MRQSKNIIALFTVLIVSGLVLQGCSRKMYEEGNLTENRIQVEETQFSEKMNVADFDQTFARGLGHYYRQSGDGTVDFTVLYDPKSHHNTAMHASQEASRIATLMREEGISDVNANILPVNELGSEAQVLVSFASYSAHGPKDCGSMPGYKNTDIGFQEDYKLGCTVESVFARQVARPKDLLGNDDAGVTTDGRRAANIGEIYRSGAPNQPLEGQSASGE